MTSEELANGISDLLSGYNYQKKSLKLAKNQFQGFLKLTKPVKYYAKRFRSASNRTTPVATETFSEPTRPAIGIVANSSTIRNNSSEIPSSSEPITTAVGTVKSIS